MNSAQINKRIAKPGALEKRKQWYLDKKEIRPKTQYKWTMEERMILYELRIEREMTIPEIQRYFRKLYKLPIPTDIDDKKDKYSRTRIHNQIRIVKGVIKGLCYKCRKPLTTQDMRYLKKNNDQFLKLCKKCRKEISKYKRERRNELLKLNICPICGQREILKGKTACKICLSSSHRLRYIEGLCGRCGKRPIAEKSISLCEVCLRRQKKNSRKNKRKE
jgi:hypothetical protein